MIEEDNFYYTWGAAGQTTRYPHSPSEVYSVLEDIYGTEGVPRVWWLEDSVSKECRVYAHEDGQLRRVGWVGRERGIGVTVCGANESGDYGLVSNPEDAG